MPPNKNVSYTESFPNDEIAWLLPSHETPPHLPKKNILVLGYDSPQTRTWFLSVDDGSFPTAQGDSNSQAMASFGEVPLELFRSRGKCPSQ
jgi:hypothetical protein